MAAFQKGAWRIRPTYQGWYYLVLVAAVMTAATIRQVNLMLLIGGVVAGPLIFSWWTARANLRHLVVRRRLPREVCAGDTLVVRIDLENQYRRRGIWSVLVEDEISGEGDRAGHSQTGSVLFHSVPAGKRQSLTYRGRLLERGRYRFGPIRLVTRFPFGLFKAVRTLSLEDRVVVFPRLGRLAPGWHASHHSYEGRTQRERRSYRATGEFFGVRQFRHGDSARHIHWRSSAKHGDLVVRQFERPRNRDVVLLIDLKTPAQGRDGKRQREATEAHDPVELAVSFAATFIDALCRHGGGNLVLGIGGREIEWLRGPASSGLLEVAMEKLALVASTSESKLPGLLGELGARASAASELVVVSTRSVEAIGRQRLQARLPRSDGRVMDVRTVDTSTAEVFRHFSLEDTLPREPVTEGA